MFYLYQSNLITTNSRKNYEIITAQGHKTISIVQNYNEFIHYRSIKKKHDVFRLLIVSRLEPQKRILETIKKISSLNCCRQMNIDIYGIGSQQSTISNYIFQYSKIKKQKVSLRLHGFVPTEKIPFHKFDLSLHFSTNEGASNAMIEALAYGIPVLCSKHHKQEVDFLVPGKNCYVCELDELDDHIKEINSWCIKINRESVRKFTEKKLNVHPFLHDLIIRESYFQ